VPHGFCGSAAAWQHVGVATSSLTSFQFPMMAGVGSGATGCISSGWLALAVHHDAWQILSHKYWLLPHHRFHQGNALQSPQPWVQHIGSEPPPMPAPARRSSPPKALCICAGCTCSSTGGCRAQAAAAPVKQLLSSSSGAAAAPRRPRSSRAATRARAVRPPAVAITIDASGMPKG